MFFHIRFPVTLELTCCSFTDYTLEGTPAKALRMARSSLHFATYPWFHLMEPGLLSIILHVLHKCTHVWSTFFYTYILFSWQNNKTTQTLADNTPRSALKPQICFLTERWCDEWIRKSRSHNSEEIMLLALLLS